MDELPGGDPDTEHFTLIVIAKEEAIRANACEGSTKAKKGNNIKIQVTPLNPGIKPDSKPTTKPKIIKTK